MADLTHVAIIGLGLMGGSLGLALRQLPGLKISGYARRAETRRAALRLGVVDDVFDLPAKAVENAQLVVVCTPVDLICDMAEACADGLAPGSIVTDVGSSKAEVVAGMDGFFTGSGVCFVGSHPIAGSEKQGLDAARADLYRDAVVAITPSDVTDPSALKTVGDFWQGLGARVYKLAPAEHDRVLASTSHLPHLVAAVLAATVGRREPERLGVFCGSGFWDTTRVADGDPALWHDIIKTNQPAVLAELQAFKAQLDELTSALAKKDLTHVRDMLAGARHCRRALASCSKVEKI